MALDDTQRAQLTQIVSRASFRDVVLALAEIARENARLVEWNDKPASKAWGRTAKALDNCASKPAIGLR